MAVSKIGGQVDNTHLNPFASTVPELAIFQTNKLPRLPVRLAFKTLLASVLLSSAETMVD